MLRPAKLFTPFHQFRHYLQTKVTELVEPTLKAFPSSQQPIVSRLQQALIQPKAPILQVIAEQQQKRLLGVIQRQFPVFKVFSFPTIAVPQYNLSFAKASQHRTLYASGHFVEFHRMVVHGHPRAPFASRQFSTSRVVNFSPQGGQSIFAHISSRFFAPVGSKMNHNGSSELSSSDNGRLVSHQQVHNDGDNKFLYQRKQVIPLRSKHTTEPACNMPIANCLTETLAGLSSPAEHDELALTYSMKLAQCGYIQNDGMSDEYIVGRHLDNYNPTQLAGQVENGKENIEYRQRRIYLSIALNSVAHWKTPPLSNGVLDGTLLRSVIDVAEFYRIHFNQVISLLQCIRRCGELLSVIVEGELRVFFPSTVHSTEEALRWLRDLGVNTDNPCFTLRKEQGDDIDVPLDQIEDNEPDMSGFPALSSDLLGPEYFKDIQLFLDHVDELIDNSAAFSCRLHCDT
ncbi:hypothetical protein DFQ28_002986 [Apophysomyces sp. BC1034]|nr:hypothetical protein DFQ30_006449 [Apophysomyces sp. BC1015]KAG0176411.1 hypothetical protein DFQ29_006159 [Apophysomyces sp. BC1021]KAG0193834.1 hypothetical protein DFQ28_002986 [Apophysomyces sp. BC1034]